MTRRRRRANPYPADWEVSTTFKRGTKLIEPGAELSIKRERGRFHFVKHVKTPTCEWIDVIGGPKKFPAWRSFRPDQIRTVHRLRGTRADRLAEERLRAKAELKAAA